MTDPDAPWILPLADLASAAVPPPGGDVGALDHLARRLPAMSPEAVETLRAAAAAGVGKSAVEAVTAWADAPAGSAEAGWFVAVRQLGWEILLADPRHGGNRERAGWRLFGYRGRTKTRP